MIPKRWTTGWLLLAALLLPTLACTLELPAAQTPAATLLPTPLPATLEPETDAISIPTPPPTAVGLAPITLPVESDGNRWLAPGLSYAQSLEAGAEATFALRNLAGRSLFLTLSASDGLDGVLSGSAIPTIDDQGQNGTEVLFFAPADDSLQTIRVSGADESNGRFTLALLDLSQLPFPDALNTQDSIDVGGLNRHRFPVSAGASYMIIVEPQGDFDPIVELYAPDGFLDSLDGADNGQREIMTFTAAANGDYVTTVFGRSTSAGGYQIRIFQLP